VAASGKVNGVQVGRPGQGQGAGELVAEVNWAVGREVNRAAGG
jgi:hypothetical protein